MKAWRAWSALWPALPRLEPERGAGRRHGIQERFQLEKLEGVTSCW